MFADETKGQEAGAFYKEDGSLLIFLDPSVIDMSDSRQVFNGIMYEMNHYNPTNPYVYDKSEKVVEKGYKLEEDFTEIGRKPITDSENHFYYEILKGSDVLGLGNLIYSEIDDKDLDNHMRDPEDSKFTRAYVNQYQRCYQGGSGSSCYDKVDRNAKVAEKKVKTPPKILCGKTCQEKKDKEREAEFVKAMNSEIDLSVFGGSPGALNSYEQGKIKKDMSNAVSAIQDRFPNKSKEEIQNALNKWGVTPTKDGRIKIEIDGQLVFRVDNYDNNLGAYYALSSDDGLGIISGGLYSLSKVTQTKAEGNYVMDFSGDFVSLEMQGALVAEVIAAQKYNSKLQEMKNLNKPTIPTSDKWKNEDGSVKWPPNNGAVAGSEKIVTLPKGQEIGRIGGDHGTYVAPPKTPSDKLSLAPGTDVTKYTEYRIIKPIPGVERAQIAPWFDKPGGGIQYKMPMSIKQLIDGGYIEPIK